MRKGILLFSLLAILSCNKDKSLEEDSNSFKFNVSTQNRDVNNGLRVGQVHELVYDISEDYKPTEDNYIEYSFDTNTSNFTASDNQGNAEVEVWKKYKVKQSPLKISYKPTGKGVHKVKVTFTNKKGFKVEKEINLNTEASGVFFSPLKDNYKVGEYVPFEFEAFGFPKSNSTSLIISVEEDTAGGNFYWQKGGEPMASKGRSFEVIANAGKQIFYYKTDHETSQRNFDEIRLKIKPKQGEEEQNFSFSLNFSSNALNISVTTDAASKKIGISLESGLSNDNNFYAVKIIATEKEINLRDYRINSSEGKLYNKEGNAEDILKGDISFKYLNQVVGNFGVVYLKPGENHVLEVNEILSGKIYIHCVVYNRANTISLKNGDNTPENSYKSYSAAPYEGKVNVYKGLSFKINLYSVTGDNHIGRKNAHFYEITEFNSAQKNATYRFEFKVLDTYVEENYEVKKDVYVKNNSFSGGRLLFAEYPFTDVSRDEFSRSRYKVRINIYYKGGEEKDKEILIAYRSKDIPFGNRYDKFDRDFLRKLNADETLILNSFHLVGEQI